MSAGGVGESKRFGGRPAAQDDDPLLNCHVGGVLVKDMIASMEPAMGALWRTGITYDHTDEGLAARAERGVEPSGIESGAGMEDKALQQRRDEIKDEGFEPYMAKDLMKELADKHVAPGMKGKYLSSRKVKENGGTGDYEVVKKENGDPVSYKGMILGQMPAKRAKARNRFYQEKSREMLKQNERQFKQLAGGDKDAIVEK